MIRKILAITVMALGIGSHASAQLPSVTLKDINGKTVKTDTLSNNGKPFIIDFFATWCKPCNRELKAIHEVYPDWQEETGVKLIAVSIDQAQNINKVKPLVDEQGWEYEVLLDPNGDFKRALGITDDSLRADCRRKREHRVQTQRIYRRGRGRTD